jgi:chemotaxis protein histidine kinase CheA
VHYYKHDHNTSKRPEWWGIAAELGLRPLDVYAIWNLLHEHASQQHDRGSVAQFSAADIAAQYGLEKAVVEAILSEFEARGMTADGRIANWEWSQRDLSTARVYKHREESRAAAQEHQAAKEVVATRAADDPSPKRANDETDVKRSETPETEERENKSQSPPLTPPPLEVVERGRHDDRFAGLSGTRARARAGSRLSEAEVKKRRHDVVVQQVIVEAARTMRSDRFEEFAAALCDPSPPRWAREERDRLWRQIKRQRNACGVAPQCDRAKAHPGR